MSDAYSAPLDSKRSADAADEGESPFRALLGLAVNKANALAVFRSPDETIVLRIDGGRLRSCWSDQQSEDDALLAELWQSGAVAPDDLARVTAHARLNQAGLATTLYGLGLVPPAGIARAMRAVYRQRVHRAAAMSAAQLTVAESRSTSPASSLISMDLVAILASYARELLSAFKWDALKPMLAPLADGRLSLKADRPLLELLDLYELRRGPLGKALDGSNDLAGVLAKSGLTAGDGARVVLLLAAFGLLHVIEEDAARKPTVVRDLTGIRDRMSAANHFVRLDCQWWSHLDTLMTNYAGLRQRFGPNSSLRDGGPAGCLVKEIWSLVDEAWFVVSDELRRDAYRRSIVKAERVERKAALLLEWAQTAEKITDTARARRLYEVAAELCPSEVALAGVARVRNTERKGVV